MKGVILLYFHSFTHLTYYYKTPIMQLSPPENFPGELSILHYLFYLIYLIFYLPTKSKITLFGRYFSPPIAVMLVK